MKLTGHDSPQLLHHFDGTHEVPMRVFCLLDVELAKCHGIPPVNLWTFPQPNWASAARPIPHIDNFCA